VLGLFEAAVVHRMSAVWARHRCVAGKLFADPVGNICHQPKRLFLLVFSGLNTERRPV